MQCPFFCQKWWHTYAKEAPLEWWMELNRKPLILSFIGIAIASGIQAFSFAMDGNMHNLAFIAAIITINLVVAGVIAKCSLSLRTELAMMMCDFLASAALHGAMLALAEDVVVRARSHQLLMVMWKQFPAVFAFPIILAAVFIGATVVIDVAALFLCQLHHGDPFQMRVVGSSAVYALCWSALALMQTGRLRSIYDAQQALSVERALMESIVAMMCDATIWLSSDGSTILRTDPRFAILVGKAAVGEQLADSLAEEERGRVHDCLRRAKAAPVLLPTTLVSSAGARIPVDIFIVGNREINEAEGLQEKTPAFLLGIRMASRQGTEELGNVGMRQEHATLLAQSQGNREGQPPALEDELQSADPVPASLAETTHTGRILAPVDVDRWLEGTPEGQAAELRSSLERIDALGQSEHWLIGQQDLELKPDEILGRGAFAVVMGGSLHGSPVAVKAAIGGTDASVKYLVAIANELRIFRHIRHPNVALFHGALVEPLEGEVLLVLERVKGPDLARYVMSHKSDAEIHGRYQLLLDVAAALRYLHNQSPQIVHGDLKGSNVLVEAALPRAKLLDFGLSRLLTRGAKPLGGSLSWIAPELIIRPATRPSATADVFSCGRLAHMILACRMPLEGMSAAAIQAMARAGRAHHLFWDESRPLQRQCAALCRGMLSSAPEERPDMRAVHQALLAWRLPDLEEGAPPREPVRGVQGASAATPAGGALHSFRPAPAVAARQAPPPDLVPGGSGAAAGEGGAGAEALPAAGGTEESAPMALPARPGTRVSAKEVMLVDVLRQWNFPAPPEGCCLYHAAVAELQRTSQLLRRAGCKPEFAPRGEFQCHSCGTLGSEAHAVCPICDAPSLAVFQEEVPEPLDSSPDTLARCSL